MPMAKYVQMSIKMEPKLRESLLSVAAERHRPAAEIIRELTRLYIAESEIPNALTGQTLRKSRNGEEVIEASDLTICSSNRNSSNSWRRRWTARAIQSPTVVL